MSEMYYHRAYNAHACIFRCELLPDAEIRLRAEHSEHRYFALDELSPVQRQRVEDCLENNSWGRHSCLPKQAGKPAPHFRP